MLIHFRCQLKRWLDTHTQTDRERQKASVSHFSVFTSFCVSVCFAQCSRWACSLPMHSVRGFGWALINHWQITSKATSTAIKAGQMQNCSWTSWSFKAKTRTSWLFVKVTATVLHEWLSVWGLRGMQARHCSLCVCACVCLREWETEKERETAREWRREQ